MCVRHVECGVVCNCVRVVAWEGRSVCWAVSGYGGKVLLLVSAQAQAGRRRRREWRNNLSKVRCKGQAPSPGVQDTRSVPISQLSHGCLNLTLAEA